MSRPNTRRPASLRIIGGAWRRRVLTFPDADGLRPTMDRVRETAFNWLQPHLHNAYCLDLFAGSGALGLEALSRGAAHVQFIDHTAPVCQALRNNLHTLQSHQGDVTQANSLNWLTQTNTLNAPVDIVFIDPPFHQHLIADSYQRLQHWPHLSPDSLIYIEAERTLDVAALCLNWTCLKSSHAGQTHFFLFKANISR